MFKKKFQLLFEIKLVTSRPFMRVYLPTCLRSRLIWFKSEFKVLLKWWKYLVNKIFIFVCLCLLA